MIEKALDLPIFLKGSIIDVETDLGGNLICVGYICGTVLYSAVREKDDSHFASFMLKRLEINCDRPFYAVRS